MGETKRQAYTFAVKEYGDGTPYIVCTPIGKEWNVFANGTLSFVLPEGTTLKRAQQVNAFLNTNIKYISFAETVSPDQEG